MRIILCLTNITTLNVDAIVNAANSHLAPGGGVCGAIHAAAGPALEVACSQVGGCPTGEARITPGFNLPARYVIHAVGPVWNGGGHGEAGLLAGAYRSALEIAKAEGIRTIAFPAISTGIYGYPLADAAGIAVREVRRAAEDPGSLEGVIFACFSDEAVAAYRAAGIG